ncbi:hypothetical protein GCM10023168_12230 [Fodinibacter luteus]|uniref:Uncharacterized protein n=1 Tax=Fodinibacter luteus TaxID=552064 RepID=A0ABP8K904_9MICO
MTTQGGPADRLGTARVAWAALRSAGGPLAGLADDRPGLDDAVRALEGVWAGRDAPLGARPPWWAGAPGARVLAGSLPAGALPVLDALAVRAGDLEVEGARAVGARWAPGTSRDAGLLVVTDDGRGTAHAPVRGVLGCIERIRSGADPRALSALVDELVGTRVRTEEDWARQALESFSPWETHLLRPRARGPLRRRPRLERAQALDVAAELAGQAAGTRASARQPVPPDDLLVVIDPGAGWWRAVVTLDAAGGTSGDAGVAAVRVTVTGAPEDSQRRADPGHLALLVHRVRRVADAHGLEVERSLGPGRSWEDDPPPVP